MFYSILEGHGGTIGDKSAMNNLDTRQWETIFVYLA